MARKLTPKQLKFRELYMELGNATEAYRRAYNCKRMSDRAIQTEACKLLKNPRVAHSIADIQAKAAEASKITTESLSRELDEAIAFAKSLNQSAPIVSAIIAKARINGLMKDKLEVNNIGNMKPTINVRIGSDKHRPAPEAGTRVSELRH